ncbi:hypothetical protein GGI12_005521, partial [Dipsacomyces acuminosporus]
ITEGESEGNWLSNIDLAISQKLSAEISALTLSDNYVFSDKAQFISEESDEIRSSQTSTYFANCTPNIRYLKVGLDGKKQINLMFTNKIVSAFFKQLYTLDTGNRFPITFKSSRFGEQLTRLTLHMNTDATNVLPQPLASQLQCLGLYKIPEHFTWGAFCSGSPNSVTFTNLHELRLWFKSETVSEQLCKGASNDDETRRIINWDADRRQLHFPKLHAPYLWNNPYSGAAFYERFEHSPLRNLRISGSFQSMKNINADMLVNLSKLRLVVYSIGLSETGNSEAVCGFRPSEEKELLLFVERAFGTTSQVKHAYFSICG